MREINKQDKKYVHERACLVFSYMLNILGAGQEQSSIKKIKVDLLIVFIT